MVTVRHDEPLSFAVQPTSASYFHKNGFENCPVTTISLKLQLSQSLARF